MFRRSLAVLILGLASAVPSIAIAETPERDPGCGTYPGLRNLQAAVHRYFERRVASGRLFSLSQAPPETAGNIVLLEGDRTIVSENNRFDLHGSSLSFSPSGNGYRVRQVAGQLEPGLGDPVRLRDDATTPIDLRFAVRFFGERWDRVFLNSDGNLTLPTGDRASTERSLRRFLTGPPRIAPFFADLDPSSGGTVRVASLPERLVVTWDGVPEFGVSNQNSFQVVVEQSGTILFRYSNAIDAETAVIGVSPGGDPADVDVIDLGAGPFSGTGAIAERFSLGRVIDDVGVAQKLFRDFPDRYDMVIVWTNFDSDLDGAFAFEITTRNDIRGIGERIFNDSRQWGSGGRLQAYIFMGNIDRYPSSPESRVFGAGGRPTTLGLLGHEVGHRWLATVQFDDQGRRSAALLGRQRAHWSFFMDSDASFLEGNDIRSEGDGQFRTVETVSRYSALDLYLMGFAPPAEVGPFFIVEGASSTTPGGQPITSESAPQKNITIRGTRRNVLLGDIIRVEGDRRPRFDSSQKEISQAWILLSRPQDPPSASEISKVEAARSAWETFFRKQTKGRGNVSSDLQ
jgi:hypothetical protein